MTTARIRLVLLAGLLLSLPARAAVLSFEDLPKMLDKDPFGPSGFEQLLQLNNGSSVYGGVTWDAGWWVAGDELIPHNDPSDMFTDENTELFGRPHSGHFGIFNGFGIGWGFDTDLYLTGVWVT